MTIDEAEKIKSVVENKKYIEQLVETVSKTLVEAFENIKIEDVYMFRLGYNKAIDDFAKALTTMYERYDIDDVFESSDTYSYTSACYIFEHYIDKIAEQLKERESE